LLAESHLDRRAGKIQTQAHPCDDDGNEEKTEADNQYMFHARRTHLAGRCVQGFLPCIVLPNRSKTLQLTNQFLKNPLSFPVFPVTLVDALS
jgi:hypothetical protein